MEPSVEDQGPTSLDVKQTSQFLITKVTDGWQDPGVSHHMTENVVKTPSGCYWALHHGHGITLKDGTLVIPPGRDENGLPFSNITYSRMEGKHG